ncbi:MAG TPA: VOC family protein [Candidatus Wallbacteria bacterium]|nr:VOC family protein [Candidatus Wallbacteria bacterium]
MQNGIRYTHTNIIAKDWKKLAEFYIEVFGCKLAPPERDLSGEWLDSLTGIEGARIRGAHLILPGFEENGPTLEIFQYEPEGPKNDVPAINRRGFGHVAFHVDDVEKILGKLVASGGTPAGKVIRKQYPELGLLTAIYAKDPEGNFIELQNWKK